MGNRAVHFEQMFLLYFSTFRPLSLEEMLSAIGHSS